MATASVNYVFANGTNADGTQVNANFNSLLTFLNGEVVHRDASIAFTAIPTLPATDPVNDNDAVRKRYVDLIIPAGTIVQYAGSSAPSGWVLCDGTAYSRVNATYSRLFAAISTNYGVGDGATTFNVPNLKGKFPVGRDAAQTEFDVLAETGGSKAITLTANELPSHSHGVGTILPNSIADHAHSVGTLTNGSTDLGSHNHTQNAHSHAVSTSTTSTGGHYHGWTAQTGYSGNVLWWNTYGTYSIPQHANAGSAPLGVAYANPSTMDQGAHNHTATGTTDSITATNISASLGSHTHTISGSVAVSGGHSHTMSGSTASSGTGSSFNNLPPYVVVNYLIKL